MGCSHQSPGCAPPPSGSGWRWSTCRASPTYRIDAGIRTNDQLVTSKVPLLHLTLSCRWRRWAAGWAPRPGSGRRTPRSSVGFNDNLRFITGKANRSIHYFLPHLADPVDADDVLVVSRALSLPAGVAGPGGGLGSGGGGSGGSGGSCCGRCGGRRRAGLCLQM